MSLSDDALRKLLNECSTKLSQHNRDKQGLNVLSATKERERKLNEFTIRELGSLGENVPTFKAVGKMFLQADAKEITAELETQNAEYGKELEALSKKREWIDRQIADLNNTLRDVMRTTKA